MNREQIINLLQRAVDIACDGGPAPFDDEEYREMCDFLEVLRNNLN